LSSRCRGKKRTKKKKGEKKRRHSVGGFIAILGLACRRIEKSTKEERGRREGRRSGILDKKVPLSMEGTEVGSEKVHKGNDISARKTV